MKKQIIAAAVATSISAIAMADVSITGNANYEYFAKEDTTGVKTNYGDTELNLKVTGKSGDTTAVVNFEVDTSGTDASTALDIEDVYITTKIGDINIKAGDFASGTSALGGEIDNGGRVTNKVSLSTKVGDATIGYNVDQGSANDTYNTAESSVTASMPIAGWTVQVKENSDTATWMGVKGSVAGIDARIEQKDSDTATSDVLFYELGTKFGGMNVSYAALDADAGGKIAEDDSSTFARSIAGNAYVDGMYQMKASTDVDGTTVGVRFGEATGTAGYQDAAFSEISATRKLASGATLAVQYDDYESFGIASGSTMTDTQVFEIDLSVSF